MSRTPVLGQGGASIARGSRGAKPGERRGGREKGSKDKVTLERERRLAKALDEATSSFTKDQIAAMTPLQVMTFTMQLAAASGWWFKAAELAEKVAPYIHPKLQSTTITSSNDLESRSTESLVEELDEIRDREKAADRTRAVEEEVQRQTGELGDGGSVPIRPDASEAPRPTLN